MTHAPYFSEHIARGEMSRVIGAAKLRQSFDDWPWYALYRELDAEFPGSKFVLTTRPGRPWVRSLLKHMAQRPAPDDWMRRHKRLLYGFSFYDATEAQLIERYESHNQAVRDYFRGRQGDLLEVDWTRGDGWRELCGFLGVPPPDCPLPHANRGIYLT